jgi:4-phytase / acid phosphatase
MPGCAVLLLLIWMVPLLPWAGAALAQDLNPQGAMVRVVILSRHGLRGPTQSIETLNSWRNTKIPGWPDFGVPPGYLTPKGEKLVEEIGANLREYLNRNRLFDPGHCPDGVLIRADRDERTVMTAQGLGSGLTAGHDPARHCHFAIHQAADRIDPLFHPSEAMPATCSLDPKEVEKAVGILNPPPVRLTTRLANVQSILRCCSPQLCQNPPCGGPPLLPSSCTLVALPSCADAAKGHASIKGGLGIAQSFAELLLLQYGQGFDGDQFGFDRANDGNGQPDKARLLDDLKLHTGVFDLVQRGPYVAARQGTNLLYHIVNSIKSGRAPNASGGPFKFIAYVGHDTNIANVAALLDLHWQLPEYPADYIPPGGALVFELRQPLAGPPTVVAFFIAQSPDAMRNETGATPYRAAVRRRHCLPSGACEMKDFVFPLAELIAMITQLLKKNRGCLTNLTTAEKSEAD